MDNKTIRHFGTNALNELVEELRDRIIKKIDNVEKSIPKKLTDLENDLNLDNTITWDDIQNKPFEDADSILKNLDETFIPDTIQRTSSVLTQANQNSLDNSYSPTVDSDLVTKEYVDSLASSELEALALVTEMGFVEPAVNNEFIFTDANGAIYTM